jgi:tRNA(His) guanylyltransferase
MQTETKADSLDFCSECGSSLKHEIERDALGDRMKRFETVTKIALPRRTYTLMRIDGRAFHTFTRGLTRPYDLSLINAMDATAVALCEQIAGAQFAYVQSDEISIVAVDFLGLDTQPWFEGYVQKWASVGASIATAAFNYEIARQYFARLYDTDNVSLLAHQPLSAKKPLAVFDARVFTIPDFVEVENYFVWRQKDAIRNSVSMLAQHYASHKQLHGKNQSAQHEVIHAAGDNWANHPNGFKNGRVIRKSGVQEWGKELGQQPSPENFKVGNWFVDDNTPVFTQNREYLRSLVPIPWDNDVIVRKAAAAE